MLAALAQQERRAAALAVEVVQDADRFERLASDWDELLESSSSDGIFLTWEWLFTWWKHLSDRRRLSLITIRDDKKLIALAPLCVARPQMSRARVCSSFDFMGSGFVGSDYLDIIVRRGYEAIAETTMSAHLAHCGRAIEWTQVRCGYSFAQRVAQTMKDANWRVRETETNTCPFIPLSGHNWESYLGTLGAEHRYNFRRKWRRLNQEHLVRLDQVITPNQCADGLDTLIRLHNLRWHGRGQSNAFHTKALVDFHEEWSRVALTRGWLRLFVLRVDGIPAAALYGFLYQKKFYFYQSGFDPAFGKYSVGLLIMGLAIQRAIENGADEFDLLHGNEEYKSHWSRQERKLGRIEMDPPGLRGWISDSTIATARHFKHLVVRKRLA